MLMQPIKRGLAALALAGLALPALAQTTVSEAWVRASVPHQQSTGAFMTLTASSDSKLVSVASPVAKTVQVHEMTMNGDVMGMREVKAVELPAGKAVTLDPNGLHVMLMGLNGQVKEGETICIIEAMKILNEIEADKTGTITRILGENGQAVEYGQPLFVIE